MSFADRDRKELKGLLDLASKLGSRVKALAPSLEELQSAHDTAKEFDKTLERYPFALQKVMRQQERIAQELIETQRKRVEVQESVEDKKESISRGLHHLSGAAAKLAQEFSTPIELPEIITEFLANIPARSLYLSELGKRVDVLIALSKNFSKRLEEVATAYAEDEGLPFLFTAQQGTDFEPLAGQVASLSADLRRLKREIKDGQSLGAKILTYLDREDELQQQSEIIAGKLERLKQGELATLEQCDDTRRRMRDLGQSLILGLDAVMGELAVSISRYQKLNRGTGTQKSDLTPVLEVLNKERAIEITPSSPLLCAGLAQRFWNVTLVCTHLERVATKAAATTPTMPKVGPGKAQKLGAPPRYMSPRDVPEVLAIEAASFDAPWVSDNLLDALRSRSVIANVVEVDSQVRGYLLWEIRKHSLQIIRLAVHPGFRHLGIGRRFAEKLIEKVVAPDSRKSRVFVDVPEDSLDAQLFFRACGFKAVSVSEDGHYRMAYSRADGLWVPNISQ